MDEGFRIFVVDDDPLFLEVLEGLLSHDYKVETFSSAGACQSRLTQTRPDMFIIDVNMPEVDGYALCRSLKNDLETQDLPVIFVSAADDIETRLAGYEAGGEDFILKPIQAGELESKVKIARRILFQNRTLHEQAGFAQRTALSAMTSMGELGVVLQFLSKSFACNTVQALGTAVLETLQQFDLQGAVQIRVGAEVHSMSPNGIDLPLEVAVLNHVRNSGRIFQFRSRCVFNHDRLTLLVNNMPPDDVERCGRIRDNAALLVEGADARLRAIEIENENLERQRGVARALPRVHTALESVQANYRRNCFELTQLMIGYQEKLLKSFVHLGLTEAQEEYLSSMAHVFLEEMVGTQDQSLAIVGELEGLAKDLEKLAKV